MIRPGSKRLRLWLAIVSLPVLTLGCGQANDGPERFHYSGTVTYDGGKPVPKGFIQFIPAKGNTGPGSGANIVDGKYETADGKGVIGGPHTILINGSDGIPYQESGETVETGKSLFPKYETEFDFPKEDGEKNFEVPKAEGS